MFKKVRHLTLNYSQSAELLFSYTLNIDRFFIRVIFIEVILLKFFIQGMKNCYTKI
jgi:hypothetical protein